MQTKLIAAAIVSAVSLLPMAAAAQDAQQAPAAPPSTGGAAAPGAQAGAKPGAHDLAKWWEKSSLDFDPVPDQLLKHIAIDFSFSDSRGNTSGTVVSKHAEVALRKRRLTNRFQVDIRDTNMVYGMGGGSADYHQSTLRNHVEYDLTKLLVAVGGIELARNTLYFLDSRVTVYGGLGATVLSTPQHRVNVIGGLGHASFTFMRDEMAQIDPIAVAALPTTTPDAGGALVMQAWKWTPNKAVSFQQNFSALEYFGGDLGHLITFDVSATVPVNRHIAFVPRYTLKDEANIYIEALGVETLDRTFGIGIRVSF